MILSDRENKLAVRREHLRITPLPPDAAFASTSVDLTLHKQLTLWSVQAEQSQVVAYPARSDFVFSQYFAQHCTTLSIPPDGFLLKPGGFVLGWTQEKIWLPHASRLAARVEGRSSLARLGIGVHVTAPTIHSGFGAIDDPQHEGTRIRLEIWNCGPIHVCLEKGMKVCQLIVEEVHGTPDKGYEGVFATQAPAPSPVVSPKASKRNRRK